MGSGTTIAQVASMSSSVSQFAIHVRQLDGYRFETSFDGELHEPLVTDEPPPLSRDAAPNPVRILAAAVGSCLSASLVFCMSRSQKIQIDRLTADVEVEIVRNEQRRLRVGAMRVAIRTPEGVDPEALGRCRDLFEDFCTVTQSVRDGIPIDVAIAPASA